MYTHKKGGRSLLHVKRPFHFCQNLDSSAPELKGGCRLIAVQCT